MESVTFTGGCRVGESSYWEAVNYSRPLATLIIGQDQIRLNMPFKNITLRRNQITGIKDYRGIFSDGIQIEHSSKDSPRFLVFWTSDGKVAEALQLSNYPYQKIAKEDRSASQNHVLSIIVHVPIFFGIFLILLAHEYQMKRGTPDAILNSAGLTLFLAVIYFVLRKRILR